MAARKTRVVAKSSRAKNPVVELKTQIAQLQNVSYAEGQWCE